MSTWLAPSLLVLGIITIICIGDDRNAARNNRRGISAVAGLLLTLRGIGTITVFVLAMKFLGDLLNMAYPHKP